jgi:hypothetical protein
MMILHEEDKGSAEPVSKRIVAAYYGGPPWQIPAVITMQTR